MALEGLGAVVLASGLAALCALLGALPHALGRRPARPLIGWANALAAGLMLGVAYVLLTQGLAGGYVPGGLGALLALGFVRASHAAAGTGELDVESPSVERPDFARKAVLVDTLHAADEGVAIGVAMAISPALGVATAATLAVHNVPEAMVLNTVLVGRGAGLLRSALVTVAVNGSQVALAVAAFAAVRAWPALLPGVAGFGVGALVYRTLVELLPESYHQAGKTSIAMVTLLSMGVVVLLLGAAR